MGPREAGKEDSVNYVFEGGDAWPNPGLISSYSTSAIVGYLGYLYLLD